MYFISASTFLASALAVAVGMVCIVSAQASPVTPAVNATEAYGLCQTDCNSGAVACYKSNNATFGTVVAIHGQTLPGILTCNKAQGDCQAACAQKHLKNPSPPATRRKD